MINHFPNYFADRSSTKFYKTRIVRIPRCYDTVAYSDLIPQFSTVYPGKEKGAIKLDEGGNITTGLHDRAVFGTTSEIVGFENILPEEELLDIITRINQILYDAFYPFNIATLMENIMEALTGGTFIQILNLLNICTYTKRKIVGVGAVCGKYQYQVANKRGDDCISKENGISFHLYSLCTKVD